ncbi:LOW QUALITY PROTEIN: uncharacterized protein LOC124453463 [Xenia sp. Carnegie-2017]|uniref:LOW QUALITY PROTEIN: uncharacterized protein LOC124453463 n=1 Tax=Xenia sp. Carnegie-2017 TaxID=2897299 RepID=UPI001F04D6BE|nr:LOW QUALITY PROTEIN: uncharacterized protein LOC124453463 [Xenia sp. Carnegie-2017]
MENVQIAKIQTEEVISKEIWKIEEFWWTKRDIGHKYGKICWLTILKSINTSLFLEVLLVVIVFQKRHHVFSWEQGCKKNQKRAEKRAKERALKLKEDGVIDRLKNESKDSHTGNMKLLDPVEELKAKLQEAKDKQDHTQAARLRKELWIMQDKMAGFAPPEEEVERSDFETNTDSSSTFTNNQETSRESEKRLRGLRKKLVQIEKLKMKREEGEIMEDLQIAKIQMEEMILKEIGEIVELLG